MDGSRPSRLPSIPQFLLDTRHPWLLENQELLELLPPKEISEFICSPPGTKIDLPASHAEPGDEDGAAPLVQDLQVPDDLFNDLMIDNNQQHTRDRAGWPNAFNRLREMQQCPPAALARVRNLHVHVHIRNSQHDKEHLIAEEWHEGPTNELFDMFVSVLSDMTGLEKIRWEMLPEFTYTFRDNFAARRLRMPSVRILEPSSFCEYMVDACPNIEVLESVRWFGGHVGCNIDALVEAAKWAPKLKSFTCPAIITVSSVSAMPRSMPHLTSLKFTGRVPSPPSDGELYKMRRDKIPYKRPEVFKKVVPILAEFPCLEELCLPHPLSLNWYRRIYKCGTGLLFAGPGAFYSVRKQALSSTEEIASLVIEALPRLKRLTVGEYEATITHDEDGKVTARYPWTGRLDEYLHELGLRKGNKK